MLWLSFFYTHNQHNYPNKYQIINYSFENYLLAEQRDVLFFLFPHFHWVLLFNAFCFCFIIVIFVISIIINTYIIIIIIFIIFIIIIICFVFNPFVNVYIVLYYLIFFSFLLFYATG